MTTTARCLAVLIALLGSAGCAARGVTVAEKSAPLVGVWESTNTDSFSTALEFRPNGTCVRYLIVALNGRYTLEEGNRLAILFKSGDKSEVGGWAYQIHDGELTRTDAYGRVNRATRVTPGLPQSPILGTWTMLWGQTTTQPAGWSATPQYERFLPDGTYAYRFQMPTSEEMVY